MVDLTGDARPRFFDALLEEQVRRARSVDGRLSTYKWLTRTCQTSKTRIVRAQLKIRTGRIAMLSA